MMGSGMNFITTVVAFAMSSFFIVFVCSRIICGRIRGSQQPRQMLQSQSGIDLEQQQEHVTGLEPVVVAALPTLMFGTEAFSSIQDTQCSICLGEYQEREVLRIMPKCGHNYHLSCIDTWLRKQSTCPVCRLPLRDSAEAKQTRAATFRMIIPSMNSHHTQWLVPFSAPQTQSSMGNQTNNSSSTNSEMNT